MLPTLSNYEDGTVRVYYSDSKVTAQSTPDYGKKRGDLANLPMNPYLRMIWLLVAQKVDMRRNGKLYTSQNSYDRKPSMSNLSLVEDSLISEADGKATRLFYDAAAKHDWNALVFAGEFPKTISMLSDTAVSLGKAFRSLKRFDPRGFIEALGQSGRSSRKITRDFNQLKRSKVLGEDVAPSKWLEYKYGWTPMLADLYNLADATQKGWSESAPIIAIRGSGSSTLERVLTRDDTYYKYASHQWARASVRHTHHFELYSNGMRNLSALGLTNPLTLAWELLPYSFVVDWFIPIGDFINAQSALGGLKHLKGCRSVKFELSEECNWEKHRSGSSKWVTEDQTAHFIEKSMYLRRDPTSSVPSTFKIFDEPKLSKLLNLDKAATSLALLYQAFRR